MAGRAKSGGSTAYSARMGQLRFSRPSRRANVDRLTERQQALLAWLRGIGRPASVGEIERLTTYSDGRGACERLCRRGLAVKLRPGVYRARALRERVV